jgi:hypothetical protein
VSLFGCLLQQGGQYSIIEGIIGHAAPPMDFGGNMEELGGSSSSRLILVAQHISHRWTQLPGTSMAETCESTADLLLPRVDTLVGHARGI